MPSTHTQVTEPNVTSKPQTRPKPRAVSTKTAGLSQNKHSDAAMDEMDIVNVLVGLRRGHSINNPAAKRKVSFQVPASPGK